MKKLLSVLFALLLLVSVSGCSDSNKADAEIHIFLPGEYISQDVVNEFERQTNIKVTIDNFASNEEMYTKLLGGASYDVLIPSDYMIEKLIQENMLQEIDKSIIDNLDDLYEGVLNQEYDPNNDYSVPYFWGNVGIVYDSTKVAEEDVMSQGWEVLRNPKYKGILYMYDSARDSFMIPLKVLGYSMNTDNETELQEAYNWLLEQNQTMDVAYATDECIDGLAFATEGKYLGVMYSGDAAYIISENENMRFYAPKEGTNFWVDAMVIPSNAKNVKEANMFIKYMIEYDSQYDNSLEYCYSSVNKDALADLCGEDGEFYGNEAYLPRTRNNNDEVFHTSEVNRKLTSELWNNIMMQ